LYKNGCTDIISLSGYRWYVWLWPCACPKTIHYKLRQI